MAMTKPIQLRGRIVGGGKEPLVCAPLVARDEAGLLSELAAVVAKGPDLIEWRVDFFAAIGDTARVLAMLRKLRDGAREIPIVFTRRSTREGGEPIPLSETQVVELYEAACASGCVDFLDCELSCEDEHFQRSLAAAKTCGALLIASFHNFQETPGQQEIIQKFIAMEQAGAHVAKVAVMPRSMDDVLTLLAATLEGNRRVAVPVISMSMAGYGSLTRLFGWAFGSAVTFAVGEQASAPGQVPIGDLRAVLDVGLRAFGR